MKKTFRTRTAKVISAVLVAAFTFTLIPMALGQNAVEAATAITKNQDNTYLGVSNISNPTSGGDTNSDWAGCYVYFGNYNGPIKFRVLQVDSTAHTTSEALFLDSDKILFDGKRFDDESNLWKDSELRNYLNGDFIDTENGYFTAAEVSAIALSTVDPHDLVVGTGAKEVAQWTKNVFGQYVALNEDYIFVLDAEEASNSDYGYSYTDESCASRKKTGGTYDFWWLRSAWTGDDSIAGFVDNDGILGVDYVSDGIIGVAPALNINQESIIFNTAVENEANAYKLTLSDSNLKIAVPAGQYVTATGTTISVPYSISGDDAGNATRASVLILDENNENIIFYDALDGTFSNKESATGTFTLPAKLDIADWGTEYHVYILAEDINEEKITDYASEPVEIWQTYTVTYQVANGTWSDNSTADITETVVKDSSPVNIPTGMIASSGYAGGSWDKVPSSATISADTTFTYTFDVAYTVTVQNDGNGTATADVTSGVIGTEVKLTATPSSGYQFKEWQVVSGGVTVTDNKFSIGSSDVTVKAIFEAESVKSNTYTIVGDGDITWTEGDSDLVVTVKRSEDDEHCFDRYEYAAIDGTKLTSEQASAVRGSTVITIKSDFLKTLGEGNHTFLVNFTDASITTTITIVKKSSGAASVPATGEMIGVTAVAGTVMILSACSILIVMRTKKREDEL